MMHSPTGYILKIIRSDRCDPINLTYPVLDIDEIGVGRVMDSCGYAVQIEEFVTTLESVVDWTVIPAGEA